MLRAPRCPGQGFALAEVSLLVSLVVAHCDLRLLRRPGGSGAAPAPAAAPGFLERLLWTPAVERCADHCRWPRPQIASSRLCSCYL